MLPLLARVSPSLTRLAIRDATTSTQSPRHLPSRFVSRTARPAQSTTQPKEPLEETPVWNEDAAAEFNEKEDQKARRWARLELPWCKDRVQLSQRVEKMLRNGQHRLALELTRMASKRPNSAVMSWNLLLKFHLTTNKAKPRGNFTMKLFTEMKQRNQAPDLYTYNILLWGLSIHPEAPWAVEHAMKLYQKMTAPGSKITPNQINTHLLLQLCGRAGDLDRLWEVVGMIPESGPSAPSSATYTIILNALRTAADAAPNGRGVGPDDGQELFPRSVEEVQQAARNEAVDAGRRVWASLLSGWRAGHVKMDSQLVFSMGKLLMLGGRPRDRADLFKLVEQTIGVRTAPGSLRPSTEAAKKADTAPEDKKHFDPELIFSAAQDGRVKLAPPSNHILSMVLDACSALSDGKAGVAADHYWSELTGSSSSLKLTPDTVSLKKYLHILYRTKSSRRAAKTLQQLSALVAPDQGMYRTAFSTCLRNSRSGSGLEDALAIYEVKRAQFPKQDLAMVDMLLQMVEANLARNPNGAGAALGLICRDVASSIRKKELASSEVEDLNISQRGIQSPTHKDWPTVVRTLVKLMNQAEAADVQPVDGWKEGKAILSGYVGGRSQHEDWFIQTRL